MAQNYTGIADPTLVAKRSLQLHRWYSTWYGGFGVANFVMAALVNLFGPPWGWVLPIAIAVAGLVPLVLFVRRNRSVALSHRRASAVFWIGLAVLWAVTCPIALSSADRRWVFWLGGALMLALGLVTAALIRRRADAEHAVPVPHDAVF